MHTESALSASTTLGYIDSASLYEVVNCLRYLKADECYRWGLGSFVSVTTALIHTPSLKLGPSPTSVYRGATGPYGILTQALAGMVGEVRVDQASANTALSSTRAWATRFPDRILRAYRGLETSSTDFPIWRDRYITNAWTEHTWRLGGLFNEEFVPQIARVLDVSDVEIRRVLQHSQDIKIVERYSKSQPDTDEFRIMRDAFMVSTLIRGRYHDYFARASGLDIMHHQMRRDVLPSLKGRRQRFKITNSELALSAILIGGAFSERALEDKILCWVENTKKARAGAQSGGIDFPDTLTWDQAVDLAVDQVKRLDIRVHPMWLENALDAIVALGISVYTSFGLTEWSSLLAGSLAYLGSRKFALGRSAATATFRGKKRLRDLANSVSGRVDQPWT